MSILVSLIFSSLSTYYKHGATEPLEDIFRTICANTETIIKKWKTSLA